MDGLSDRGSIPLRSIEDRSLTCLFSLKFKIFTELSYSFVIIKTMRKVYGGLQYGKAENFSGR